jgi:1-acyl-sn-glycerol-3-phosphate acyltransferase
VAAEVASGALTVEATREPGEEAPPRGAGSPCEKGGPERLWPFLRPTIAPVIAAMVRAAVYGTERVPETGGAVVAVNHLSAIDHPLVGAYCPRPIYYASKAELLELPVLGAVLPRLGVFPVRRGEPDRTALRHAIEVASTGRVVALHVEGTRQRFGHPGQVKSGAMLIARQAGVPIVPLGLDTFGWTLTNRKPCALVFGDPIRLDGLPSGSRGAREAAGIVGAEIVRLWRQAAEAAAAGLPPELPDGTRRVTLRPPWWSPDPPAAASRGPIDCAEGR